ncbi:MAG: monofunctional biosynthetic peptidoglycan transglycosylase [Pseudomonadota bacterium]
MTFSGGMTKVLEALWPSAVFAVRLALGLVIAAFVFLVLYRFVPVHGTTLMGWRTIQGEEVKQDWVSYDEISPNLMRAVIAAEDNKFCRHIGFDFGEIRAALNDAQNGDRLRGASTITQQTAKNAFLWPGRGPVRKMVEVGFTIGMETFYSKRRIMEVYLNVAEWGDGLFGAEAAAQERFGKSARDLTRREAALLAAVLPNPHKWRVDPPGPYVQRRTQQLQRRMQTVQREGFDVCVIK